MADWVLTTTTIYCDAVEDEVTLIVAQDGTLKCTGYTRYAKPGKETSQALKARGKRLEKLLRCEGLECHRTTQYRDKLFAGEARPERSAPGE